MFLLSLALELWLQYTCLNSNVSSRDAVNTNTCYPHFHVYIWTKFNIIWYCSFSFSSPVDMGWDVIRSQWHTEAALLYNIGRPFNLHTNHFGFYQIIEVRLMTTDISPGHWVLVSRANIHVCIIVMHWLHLNSSFLIMWTVNILTWEMKA